MNLVFQRWNFCAYDQEHRHMDVFCVRTQIFLITICLPMLDYLRYEQSVWSSMTLRSALQIANSRNNRSSSKMVHWLSQYQETQGSIARGLLTLDRHKSWCAQRFHTWPFTLPYLHINVIVRIINSSTRLFADDTSLYITVKNPIQSATLLNSIKLY